LSLDFFEITAKAIDEHGYEGPEETFKLTIPKNVIKNFQSHNFIQYFIKKLFTIL